MKFPKSIDYRPRTNLLEGRSRYSLFDPVPALTPFDWERPYLALHIVNS